MSIPGQFNTLAMFSTQTSNFKFILLFHIWISSSLCLPAPFQNFHLIPPSPLWLLTSSHGEPRTDQSPSDIYPFFYMRHRTPSHPCDIVQFDTFIVTQHTAARVLSVDKWARSHLYNIHTLLYSAVPWSAISYGFPHWMYSIFVCWTILYMLY